MGRREFEVPKGFIGSRLESFLRKELGLARPVALKALRKGWVRVNGRRAKASHRLEADEIVKITNYALPLPAIDEPQEEGPPTAPQSWVELARSSLRFEDEHVVVSSKPAGIPTHKGTGHDHGWIDAVGAVLGVRVTPVGRLDRDTSGLLALTRSQLGSRELFAALRTGALARTYLALVAGTPAPSGVIDRPLLKRGTPGHERMHVDPSGQEARTRYQIVRSLGAASLMECTLETGRTHQIRAHLHDLGHPLLGDPKYHTPESLRVTKLARLERLFLHAATLRFPHPEDGETRSFSDPLPPALKSTLERLAQE